MIYMYIRICRKKINELHIDTYTYHTKANEIYSRDYIVIETINYIVDLNESLFVFQYWVCVTKISNMSVGDVCYNAI